MAEQPQVSAVPGEGGLGADQPAAVGARSTSKSQEEDEESEWEYEYSATETDTYYLTLDLSYPEFKSAAPPNPHHSRGGYYKKWLTQPQDTAEPTPVRSVSRVPNAPRPDNHDDNDNEPVPGADDDMLEIDPSLRVDEGAGTANGTSRQHEDENGRLKQDAGRLNEDDADQSESEDLGPLQDVQILDLHSKRPVISYRGHVFEGQWAEMIGTDLILAHHEPGSEDPLPALRNLAGDIDILAASSSRILTTKKTLKPRVAEEDSLAPIRKDWNINIPVGKSKNADRVHQADFLERLIALKIKKGDKDKVTVYARDGEGKHFQDDKDPAYRPRRKRTTDVWEEGKRKRRRSGRPPGRPSKRASQQRGISHGEPEPEILSVPTPKRWEDLEGEGEDEDEGLEDIEDIEDIEEEEEEAVLSGDEDDDQDESDDDVEGENVGDDDQSVGDEDSGDEGDTMEAG